MRVEIDQRSLIDRETGTRECAVAEATLNLDPVLRSQSFELLDNSTSQRLNISTSAL